MRAAIEAAIRRAAEEAGIDPATALAFAERESSFNPQARNSKTIRGLFQMRGDLRAKYGIGDSDDPYQQTAGWARFIRDVRGEMAKRLGREVSDAESYAGHHFGGARAARMMQMDPATPLDAVFTPNEIAQNPHFTKAGNVGRLLADVTGDIDTRRQKFGGSGGGGLDLAAFGTPLESEAPDLSSFGDPVEPTSTLQAKAAPPRAPDLSMFGTPV